MAQQIPVLITIILSALAIMGVVLWRIRPQGDAAEAAARLDETEKRLIECERTASAKTAEAQQLGIRAQGAETKLEQLEERFEASTTTIRELGERAARAEQTATEWQDRHADVAGELDTSKSGNFWDPSNGCHGMFDVWSFRDIEAVISSGLGGGSLIYANVMIRKDENWFVRDGGRDCGHEYWAITRKDLDPHYDVVEPILGVQRYPFSQHPYNQTSKTQALRDAASALGAQWFLPNLAVTFANEGEPPVPGQVIDEKFANLHGLPRTTCRLCGECDIGCNYGSKNTLDYNFLSLAKLKGADLRTRHEVRSFEPAKGGFVITYVVHTPESEGVKRDSRSLPLYTMTADRLILSAGTLGSTYLLLKNLDKFPRINREKLGSRFSGNGDLLTFAFNCTDPSSGEDVQRRINASHGPVITSTIRIPDYLDGGTSRGFYLQDAGYPDFVNWLLEASQASAVVGRIGRFAKERLLAWLTHDPHTEITRHVRELIGPCTISSTSMPVLGMGRDCPDGHLYLDRTSDRGEPLLELDWVNVRSRPYYQELIEKSRQVAEAMGADFEENPLNRIDKFITVHPLGGCPMADDPKHGVVDPHGQVYGCDGLYVADGAVMPGPVGPNPSLTIAALADRFSKEIVDTWKRKP